MFVKWTDEKHSLGIPEIDQQHQELFFIANQIYESKTSTHKEKELDALFKRLYAYTKYHFSSEEAIFDQYAYPSTTEHKTQHENLTKRLKEQIEFYRENPQKPLDELLDFLVEWIVNHIQGDDRQYRDYFKEQKIDISVHLSEEKNGKKTLDQTAKTLWKEKKLKMDIYSIDKQHEELVNILQQFNDLQKTSEERRLALTPSLIKKMLYYSQYHFSHEEELMSKFGYPHTLEHRELHQDFIYRIQDFFREYDLKKETLNDEIILFLKSWIVNHILEEDAKYKSLVREALE